MMREIIRETGETRVRIALAINAATDTTRLVPEPTADPAPDGNDRAPAAAPQIATGEPFLDHMLVTLARYAGFTLEVDAEGDLRHHLIEDVGITLGLVLRDLTPATCQRYGEAAIVMDDAWVQAALDIGGRFWYEGPLPNSLYDHFLRSFAENAAMTLHLRVLRGRDQHHVVESGIKAVGLALRRALAPGRTVFSTKGAVRIERSGPLATDEV